MATPDPWKPDRAARTSRLPKPVKANLPTPVAARAEQLCDLVDEADGIRPDRQDLLAVLVFDVKPDGRKLAAAWARYRVAKVHQVVLNEAQTTGALDLTGYKKRA